MDANCIYNGNYADIDPEDDYQVVHKVEVYEKDVYYHDDIVHEDHNGKENPYENNFIDVFYVSDQPDKEDPMDQKEI